MLDSIYTILDSIKCIMYFFKFYHVTLYNVYNYTKLFQC